MHITNASLNITAELYQVYQAWSQSCEDSCMCVTFWTSLRLITAHVVSMCVSLCRIRPLQSSRRQTLTGTVANCTVEFCNYSLQISCNVSRRWKRATQGHRKALPGYRPNAQEFTLFITKSMWYLPFHFHDRQRGSLSAPLCCMWSAAHEGFWFSPSGILRSDPLCRSQLLDL